MKNPFGSNFKPEQNTSGNRMTLDPGAYPCTVIGSKADDKSLIMQVEITEGPAAGFFKKEYDSQGGRFRAPKYKGVYVLRFPDSSVSDTVNEMREREARGVAWAVEQSNPGYTWQWETLERDLKGKAIGINVRERDWAMKGDDGSWRTGTTWEIGRLEDIHAVREGTVKPMKSANSASATRTLCRPMLQLPPA